MNGFANVPVARGSDYIEMLASVMEVFARGADLNASFDAALRRITTSMNAEAATLFLLEGDLDDPRARLVATPRVGPSPVSPDLPAGDGAASSAARCTSGKTQIVADVRRTPISSHRRRSSELCRCARSCARR